MTWELQENKVATSIGAIVVREISTNGNKTYRYNVTVLDQNDDVFCNVTGNLADIVSPGRMEQALGIITDVRQRAESDLLP